jgi:hypothetical protein
MIDQSCYASSQNGSLNESNRPSQNLPTVDNDAAEVKSDAKNHANKSNPVAPSPTLSNPISSPAEQPVAKHQQTAAHRSFYADAKSTSRLAITPGSGVPTSRLSAIKAAATATNHYHTPGHDSHYKSSATPKLRQKPKGYCECCKQKYDNIKQVRVHFFA